MTKPYLTGLVRYVGKYGVHAPRAAVVTCTTAEVVPGTELAPLDSDTHAHLYVFTPSEVGGFPEFNVPYSEGGEPGTWSWQPVPQPAGPAGVDDGRPGS